MMAIKRVEVNEIAVLVDLSISTFRDQKVSKELTAQTAELAKADSKMVSSRVRLLPIGALSAIDQADRKLRAIHDNLTVPWFRGGHALLPVASYEKYLADMGAARRERESAVEEFVLSYKANILSARSMLGDAFDSRMYPSADEIRASFGVEIDWCAIPSAQSGTGAHAQVADAMLEANAERVKTAMSASLKRLAEELRDLITALKAKKFHASAVENLRRVLEVAPSFNLTGDEGLAKLFDGLAKQLPDADMIRESKTVRRDAEKTATDAIKKLDEVLSSMGLQ
jgi:hypothetical protein